MKWTHLLWLPLVASCAGAPLAPPSAPAAMIPPYGADKPLPPPELVRHRLANGLQVWVLPRSGPPRVDAVLAVRGGQAADPPAQAVALSGLLAELLDEGTAKRSSRQIAEELQGIGGSFEAAALADGFLVAAGALASHRDALMDLFADIVRHPVFPQKEVALAKDNALQELAASEADPDFVAERAWAAAVFGQHPYARVKPAAEGIRSIRREALVREHARRFRPDRALLVLVGRISAVEGVALAEEAFAGWQPAGRAPRETPRFEPAAEPRRVLVPRAGSVQATLRLGQPALAADSADLVPAQIAATVLGGGFTSRLVQLLREEKGYTYRARARIRVQRAGGASFGSADVRNEVTGAALADFLGEYARLGRDGIGAEELAGTRRYVAGVFVYRNQPQASMARTLADDWLRGLPPEHFVNYVQQVQAVTAAQVQDMARRYFDPARQHLVVVGDPAAIADQLKPFGEFGPP